MYFVFSFKEASMLAGIPISVPSNTITQACISSNQCLTTAAEKILSGQADIIVAGDLFRATIINELS